jgi:hypothetical protein
MEREYFDHGDWDNGLQPQRQTSSQFQPQAQPQQAPPAIVVAQRAPDAAYQTQNYQTPAYVDVLPHQLRAAAQLVRSTNPADIPSFPSLAVGIDRVASTVPWWLVLVLGAGAGYWFATKRHRGDAA